MKRSFFWFLSSADSSYGMNKKAAYEDRDIRNANPTSPVLRKSQSSSSPHSHRAFTPDSPSMAKPFEDSTVDAAQSEGSNKVVDGNNEDEQHQEKAHMSQPNGGIKRPPRFPHAAPGSPTVGGLTQKPGSHSCQGHIERLSQSHLEPRGDVKEFGHDIPIIVKDIYVGSQNCLPGDGLVKETSTSSYDENCSRFLDSNESEEVDEVTYMKAELRKLENEKNEKCLALDKEVDRTTELSKKLDKYQKEERGLLARVRAIAVENVSLKREVVKSQEREIDSQSHITHLDQQVKDLTVKMESVVKENQDLLQKFRAAKEDRDLFKRKYLEKDKECKELHQAVTRFLRIGNEQEKTIDGLREILRKEVCKTGSFENNYFEQNHLSKLLIEHLTGFGQGLRKEVESYRFEVNSLRHENGNLRLISSSKDSGFSSFKLDQELWSCVYGLRNQGVCLIDDCLQLSLMLLETYKKSRLQNGLDRQFIMESALKLQGFETQAEILIRNLDIVSDMLHEKKSPSGNIDNYSSEVKLKSDLEVEVSITRLLREKLYSKEVDVRQLEAELATAVRGNEVLRCEVQNTLDNISCTTHTMKDLEMQVIKKDESVYRLQMDLQDCKKELSIVPKLTEERDMMQEEVKRYRENNRLLSSEIEMLKKKVEALDEDVLFRDGQITILKDALAKPSDIW